MATSSCARVDRWCGKDALKSEFGVGFGPQRPEKVSRRGGGRQEGSKTIAM